MPKGFAIAVLLAVLLIGGGCVPESTGTLDREKLFVPLLGFKKAYLKIDLAGQTGSGGLLVKYLDFSGQRVNLTIISLPVANRYWGSYLGGDSTVRGKRYYGLEVEPFGDLTRPLKFRFEPLAGKDGEPQGLFEPAL